MKRASKRARDWDMKSGQGFPKHWKQCKPFVKHLIRRQYAYREGDDLHLCMFPGNYLYMYELWRDGCVHGARKAIKARGER